MKKYITKLSLSFVFFLGLVGNIIAQNKFEDEIIRFEKADSLNMPASKQILLVGSSTLRLWRTYQKDLEGYPVINRGFGGSQMSDVNYFFERLVAKYNPAQIIVYEGDNDLNAGKSPEAVLEDMKLFVAKVKAFAPKTRIAFISVKPSISRIELLEKQKQFNKLLADYCAASKRLGYIHVFDDFLLPTGEIMPDIFMADNLHLNEKGYAIWTARIRAFLKEYWRK